MSSLSFPLLVLDYPLLHSFILVSRGIKRDEKIAQEAVEPKQTMDYSLKQGEKISINLGV